MEDIKTDELKPKQTRKRFVKPKLELPLETINIENDVVVSQTKKKAKTLKRKRNKVPNILDSHDKVNWLETLEKSILVKEQIDKSKSLSDEVKQYLHQQIELSLYDKLTNPRSPWNYCYHTDSEDDVE